MKRFTEAKLVVGYLFGNALWMEYNATTHSDTPFIFSINKNSHRDFSEFFVQAKNYISTEFGTLKKNPPLKHMKARPVGPVPRNKEKKHPAESSAMGNQNSHNEKCNHNQKLDRGTVVHRKPQWDSDHTLVETIEEVYVSTHDELAY